MSDRLSLLEERIAELTEAQEKLEQRIAVLELRPATASAKARLPVKALTPDTTGANVVADLGTASKNLSLVGRTLLVLAGAFLLRAITDSGAVPTWAGVSLGFAYAGAWIGMAYRAGPAQPWNAGFHGLAAIVIGYPLLVEATTRFRLLSPVTAAGMLTCFTAVALGVAVRRRLQVLAWLVEVGGIFAAIALMIATGRIAPPLLFLMLLGVAVLWLGYVIDWVYLRWPVALVADLAVILVTLRAVSVTAAEGPRTALFVQGVLTACYLGSISVRLLLLNRSVVDFEVVQTAVVLAAGLGGAAYVTVQSGTGAIAVGLVSIVFGAATYGVAFAFMERRQHSKTNFYFYSSIAIVFVLVGTGMVLPGSPLSIAWAVLAVAFGGLARVLRRLTLGVHAAVYGVAAAIQCGAFLNAATTLLASPSRPWPPTSATLVAVIAAMAVTAWLTGKVSVTPLTVQQRIPRCALVAALVVGGMGLVVGLLVPLAAGVPGPNASAGAAATVRTGVFVAGALLLAWAGRYEEWREAGWLAYTVLVITAFKLVLEDLARSRPASLFLAFALYGTALILVPRLRRREDRSAQLSVSASRGA